MQRVLKRLPLRGGCLGVIFAKTGGVLTFVLTFATVATKQKPKSTLLPSRRKNSAAPPLGETTSRFAQIAKTAIWLSGRLGEEGFKNAGQGHNDKFRFIFPQHFTQCGFREPPLGLLLDVIMLPKMLRLFLTDIIARRNRHEFEVRCL